MVILGGEYLSLLADGGTAALKMVFNDRGAIVFPAAEQHRDHKVPGLSYEGNYEGNALAALLGNRRIEVRYHNKFSDAQVSVILSQLLRQSELAEMRDWQVTYQGRVLSSPHV